MRRLLLLALAPVAAFAACDPKLDIQSAPGDGGTEGGPGPIVNPPPPSGDDGGSGGDGGSGDDGGGEGGPMLHPIPNAPSDFAASEKFVTTSASSGYNGYFAWDSKNVYFGVEGSDVGSGANDKWILVYFGVPGMSGTTTGIAYDCSGACNSPPQQATLPFAASTHVRWKTSGFSDVQQSTGGAWAPATLFPVTIKHNGNFTGFVISRATLVNPAKLDVHMTMLIEEPPGGGNGGWTYSGVPSTSFTDGYNPTYAHYFEFDLGNTSTAPNAYTPK